MSAGPNLHPFVMHSSKSITVLALAALAMMACDSAPVEWRGDAQPVAMPSPPGAHDAHDGSPAAASPAVEAGEEDSLKTATRLVLLPSGAPTLESVPAVATSPAASDTAACLASLRTAALTRTEVYGVWWSRRARGRASLVAARSDDGGETWLPAVPVDTTDRSVLACDRPAPAIAADPTSGYVHVTYFLEGPNGPGVFFSHSMERGELFHAPVPIMYGDRPSASAVVAGDSVVVVAFEEPNGDRARIALAVSRTWGHIFTPERPQVSNDETPARGPLIALRDSVVAVAWREGGQRVLARVGTLK